jgi:hypothetical protein
LASWFGALFRRPAPVVVAPDLPAATGGISFFRLQSSQGHILSLHDASLVCAPNHAPAAALLALVPDALPWFCLLAAPDGRSFAIPGDRMAGAAVSARILRTTQRGMVRLKNPLGGMRFLTAFDHDPEHRIRFDGPGATMEAVFTLLPAEAADIPPGVHALAGQFGALATDGFRLATVLDFCRAGRLGRDLAEAALRLLPRDELDDLARQALDDPQTLVLLQTLLPDDDFIKVHLPALANWRNTRTPSGTQGQLACPAVDETLLLASANETATPLGTALHSLARGHVTPRRGFCLLASARNEGPYLLDWLSYHLSIGFEHVFLYTNDNTDGSDALLGHLARHGVITWVRNTRGEKLGVQEKAYAHALTVLPDILDYRWTAVLDLDEYFCAAPAIFDNVADFMAMHEAQPVDAVALSWLMFASPIGQAYADAPVSQRFVWRTNDVNAHVKSIFRTRAFWHSQPHYPYPTMSASFNYRSQDGGFHHHPGVQDRIPAFSANPAAEQGWINHYFLRTAPEALWKLARGSAAWVEGEEEHERPVFAEFVTRTFLDLARPGNLVEDRRIDSFAKGQPAMRAQLLCLPGVADAQEAIRRDFAQRLKALSEQYLATAPPPDAAPTLLRFRDALAQSLGVPRAAPKITPVRSRMI